MNTAYVINILPKQKLKEIEKASKKVVKLIEAIRVNIAPIFLAEEGKWRLHTRYLKQRKDKVWGALEEIGIIFKQLSESPNIQMVLIEQVLRILIVTRWDVENILEWSVVSSKAKQLVEQQSRQRDLSWTLLVMEIIHESWISIKGLERFITVTSRRIW